MSEEIEIQPITVAELMRRCDKMSFLLGLATGGLFEIINNDDRAQFQKEPLIHLLHKLMDGVDELFYKEHCDHQWIAISPEITVQSGEITAVAAQTKIKCSKCDKDYK